MDGRQRLLRISIAQYHGRMTATAIIALLATMLGVHAIAGEIPLGERKSSYDLMTADTRAMQDDDTSNPAMLWVLDRRGAVEPQAGVERQIMRRLSGDARASMAGVAARYPALDKSARTAGRSGAAHQYLSRAEKQKATPLPFESKELARAHRLHRHAVARHAHRKQAG